MQRPASGVDRTRAAIWRGGDKVALESVTVPPLQAGEVLVQVDLATVCGSDRHTVSGRRAQPCPSILGHETVGRIVAFGDSTTMHSVDGRPLEVGQRVIWSETLPCGACDRCLSGVSAKCRTVRKVGHESFESGWALSGGYAEHVLLPKGMPIALVGDEVSDDVAAPAACATATVMAVVERAMPLAGKRVVVIGAGMLGLTALAAAAASDASAVTAVDPAAERRAMAKRFGATAVVASITEVDQCDVLIELSGKAAALQEGLGKLDVQGVAVFAGSVAPDGDIAVDPEAVVRRHLSFFGVHNYEPRHLIQALTFLEQTTGRFPWSDLVADPVPLDQISDLLIGAPGPKPRYSIAP
ncbi:dehydrogenase [Mycolicibacterium litorale]|nr:dehydrogenase [Mycolicibacterium litorale]